MKDMVHLITVKRALSPVSGAGDNSAQTTEDLDRQGYESATLVIATGALSDADATFTVELLESDDDSSYTAVAAADMISQGSGDPEVNASFQFDDDNEVRTLGYRGDARYLRATITPATNTGAWLIAAVWVLGHRRVLPLTQPAS